MENVNRYEISRQIPSEIADKRGLKDEAEILSSKEEIHLSSEKVLQKEIGFFTEGAAHRAKLS